MILRTLTPVLSLVVAVVLFVFFVKPTYSETVTIKEDTQMYKDTLDKYNEFSTNLESKMSEVKKYESETSRLNTLIASTLDETKALIDLKEIAANNGVLFGNIEVAEIGSEAQQFDENGNPIEGKKLASQDISFEVLCTYDQLKSFTKDLEDSLNLYEITAMSFDTVEDSVFFQVSFTVRIYALSEEVSQLSNPVL